ncbi:hypothetical protein HAZT_HAZT000078 [Hyalella azteca]|uniref:Sphingomyelin phosphodiesterase n=1 Tax=Hyalella azteca TaxID=294128 RepID=A0A6A0H455_HYAAZ|nr:hypothetical protein HAZT_HAZT000078 [Hyalella azteca]
MDTWQFMLFLILISGVASSKDLGTQQFFDGFPDDVWDSLETEDVISIVSQFIEELTSSDSLSSRDLNPALLETDGERTVVFCEACHLGVGRLIDAYANGTSLDVIFNRTVDLCINLNISSPMFCENMIEISKPQVSWIITHKNLTAKDVCGVIFGSPTLKVLHLADTHFDPYYKPGSNAVCDEIFFCCREESGPVKAPEDSAGFWGDYRACDLPKWTVEAIYEHILAEHPDISFIIWTGDLVPHDVWNTSREGNLNIIRESVATVAQYFPSIPVFPALGNHEADPLNAFSQPYIDNEFSMDWLYGEVASLWQTWLPEDVATTIAYSGYYIVDVFPDLRLLSINTNYCYGYNWWLLYDSVDPGEVLEWMAGELQRAEDDAVYVYLISHIPSGHDDCHYTWSREYSKIVARYEGVIAGIFYGHTHKDHFQMFFDPDDPSRPIEVGFVAQSQTTYSDLNSGYKIYTIDGGHENSTYTVLDHENWYFDLDRANFEMVPTFELLYSAKEAYNMPDLSPQSHLDLIYEMAQNNSATFDLFYRNYVKAGRPRMEEGCDEDCKSDLLCRLLVADTSDRSICRLVL